MSDIKGNIQFKLFIMGNTISATNPDGTTPEQTTVEPVNGSNVSVQDTNDTTVPLTVTTQEESSSLTDTTQEDTTQEESSTGMVQPTISPVPSPKLSNQVRVQPAYVHPFIQLITKNASDAEVINTLNAFVGKIQVGSDQYNRPIYEAVDQTEFLAPILQVFSYAANNGRRSVVEWLMENYVPLNVSYDDNYCYFECLRWNHFDIADMIVNHESFYPTMAVLENLLQRSKYAGFKQCMKSPHLRGDLQTYRFTFMHYVDTNQYSVISPLLNKIKQRIAGTSVDIPDEIKPNPRFAKPVTIVGPVQSLEVVPEETPIEVVVEQPPTIDNITETKSAAMAAVFKELRHRAVLAELKQRTAHLYNDN